ncbi:beta-lactamase superfamily domain-containing protein [Cryomyces antarcticus]
MSIKTSPAIILKTLPSPVPSRSSPPAHHVGKPPTSFQNPWPSFHKQSALSALQTRFARNRNFVPVPDRSELVQIRTPDWGSNKAGLKATWIGHASFLVETTCASGAQRGVRTLFDPVFSDRTSPVSFLGPKRYTPTPCKLDDVPDVDLVVISHNHYDHLDADTIRKLHSRRRGKIHFFCALGNAAWFHSIGIAEEEVTQLDWWDGVRVEVAGAGTVNLICTPSQHFSGRGLRDQGSTLWCSWVLEEVLTEPVVTEGTLIQEVSPPRTRKLYFAGDTAYRGLPDPPPDDESSLPTCPAFAEIGETYGPFDLALLPIGLYSPRSFMSSVHCAPEDSVCIHKDIRSKRSIGMHWGTVRGGISAQYEDVREPPRRWKEACKTEGLIWGTEAGLCDIGETVVVA